ncbi:MAG TPA: TIR domain-containing protein [Pyrinomonadaceae bacterium]|nr:TIR domain-containing protein [Pyrinomonadaceae bacterium]
MEGNLTNQYLQVFLCHGSEDKPIVREIYRMLREDGVRPWLDEVELLPGQDWNAEIRRAVRQSHAILVCLSSKSVRKEGFIQKEIKFALDVAEEKPEGTIFIIPVKLDECELPERLRNWQWVDLRNNDGYDRILRSLRARADECGIEHLPGEGSIARVSRPIEDASGRTLYKTTDVRNLIQKAHSGELILSDVPPLPSDQVVAVTDEALSDLLNRYESDKRRAEEKDKLLALMGIHSPYREWQEATTKNHCFRNEPEATKAASVMERIPVRSSNLSSIGYDAQSEILEVAFHSGSVYRYFGIPEYLFQGLLNASSHGKYLDRYIKKAGYPYEQIR